MVNLQIRVKYNFPTEKSEELHTLGIGSLEKYGRTGATVDLETGIELLEEAFDQIQDDCPHQKGCKLNTVGSAYADKYKMTGAVTDLEIAIRILQKAADKNPKDHPDRAFPLQNLGLAYGRKYRITGAMADLDKSIQLLQEALDTCTGGHLLQDTIIHNLGASYGTRHQKTGAMADLEAAIQHFRKALDIAPKNDGKNDESRGRRLAGLGTAYMGKYKRTKGMEDLEMAIQHFQEALNLTPTDDPRRSQQLLKMADIYHMKYHRTKAMADLDTMIQRSKEALDIARNFFIDKTEITLCLQSLAFGHLDKYKLLEKGALADLDMAIQIYQEALEITPDDFVLQAACLEGFSSAYGYRFLEAGSRADWEMAVQKGLESLNHTSSPILDRLHGKRGLIVLCTGVGEWVPAYEAASTAMSLVPLLTPRSLENSDKQHLLTEVVDLASHAATVALMAGKTPFDAIRLLELGRGVIISSLHETRTDISELQQKHPKLAEEYLKYRAQLDSPTTSMEVQGSQRYIANLKLEEVIQEIQRLPGFDRFLLPPTENELLTAAARGPIVVINVLEGRCDAIIIEKNQISWLPLPRSHTLHSNGVLDRGVHTPVDSELLEQLWEGIAEPVLNTLGFTQAPPDGCWPRIWWIPIGPLAKFPIHAAGRHADGSSNTVLDRVISSYSSSLRALIYSQNRSKAKGAPKPEGVVLVPMPVTPGQNSLRYALQEIEELEQLCDSMQLQVRKPQPCRGDVLPALRDCGIFHFAGHGLAHQSDPAKSSLLLRDGPLTVEDLLEANFRSHTTPFLAYLSACGTGQVRYEKLIDEGLHLISAYQLAGFQHVIGTLWEVNDKSCVDVATMTYEWMRKYEISDDSVSEGLHHAIRKLRNEWVSENSVRGAIRRHGTPDQNMTRDAGQMIVEREHSGRGKERDLRDSRKVEDCADTPLHWIPYVHFGI